MVSQFIFLKSEGEIINVADIIRVTFYPAEIDEDGDPIGEHASLEIRLTDGNSITIDDDEDERAAERIYLALIQSLPNLITI